MEKTNQAFRLIVVRRPYQPRLFGEEEIDLKRGFSMERMPSSFFKED